jgi:hypothetical protein
MALQSLQNWFDLDSVNAVDNSHAQVSPFESNSN